MEILIFFFAHWILSIFFQTFFLHRYCSHRMFEMPLWMQKFCYLGTYISQGSSFLAPRAYAILHKAHHSHSDTEKDPHSPHFYHSPFSMMKRTAIIYNDIVQKRNLEYQEFKYDLIEMPRLDRWGDSWISRLSFGFLYIAFYVTFADHWAYFLLLPAHFLMGPIHGAIVNWCGHKYGYQNYTGMDESRNTLFLDFLTMGELFQNNHHKHPKRLNFAVRWFEIDPTYIAIYPMLKLGIIKPRYPWSLKKGEIKLGKLAGQSPV